MLNTSIKKKYCRVKEVNQYASLPATTLYTWANEGKTASYKIGGRILLDIEVIDRWFAASQRSANLMEDNGEESGRGFATKISSAQESCHV